MVLLCPCSLPPSLSLFRQNNNRGGYNKGDVDDTAAADNYNKQYDMVRARG